MRKEKLFTFFLVVYFSLLLIDPQLISKTVQYLDVKSLTAIFTFMVLARGFELAGVFQRLSMRILNASRENLILLFILITAWTALLAPLIMNDTVLFIMIPLALAVSRACRLNPTLLVSSIVVIANLASSLTPFGNPQNIIIRSYYSIPMHVFVAYMTPYVLLALFILYIYLLIVLKKKGLEKRITVLAPPVRVNIRLFVIMAALFCVDLTLFYLEKNVLMLVLTLIVVAIISREVLYGIDYVLLAIFALMFIIFREISSLVFLHLGILLNNYETIYLYAVLISQAISNVPAAIVLTGHVVDWRPLLLGVSVGGIGLIHSSMANIIAIRLSRIKSTEYMKYAIPLFFVILFVFLGVLYLMFPSS
ncbi:MAG: hypothetical protein J7J27_00615 [Euryarchaeota archaeon]|nr:hypothetical protein [Euryarchaeota archaeon]